MKKPAPLPPSVQTLLDAQVAWVLEQTEPAPLRAWMTQELDAVLDTLAPQLTLKDVVTPTMVRDTAWAYAADLELGPGIPELVGAIARALYAHPAHAQTTLGALISDRRLTEILNQILELDSAREALLKALLDSPLYADFVSDLLFHGIKDYLAHNSLTRNIPGASSVMKLGKSVISRATPRLEASIEEGLKKYLARSVAATTRMSGEWLLTRMDAETLRDLVLRAWKPLKRLRIRDLQQYLSPLQLEELFVSGYEYWRELRRSPYYREMIEAGVEAFFQHYGDHSFAALLDELGLSRDILRTEAERYAPHVLKVLKRKKLLEPLVRRNLERFYRSPAAAAALGT